MIYVRDVSVNVLPVTGGLEQNGQNPKAEQE